MRYAIGIEYLGKNYSGFQKQSHSSSIQEEIEKAISIVANANTEIYCAGRTDTGVHATGQVAHFNTESIRKENSWLRGINANLPRDIKINWIKEVDESFHARFSAIDRAYQYVIYNQPFNSAIMQDLVTWDYRELNLEAMNDAASYLLGEQDFNCFRSSQCQSNTSMRHISKAQFIQKGEYIYFEIIGNAFLHHMVRNIVGSLLEIGYGNKERDYIQFLIENKDRNLAGRTAPAEGLYLVGINYPENFGIPKSKSIMQMLSANQSDQ
jgi:tRNA pseudouridine38-40 synthase